MRAPSSDTDRKRMSSPSMSASPPRAKRLEDERHRAPRRKLEFPDRLELPRERFLLVYDLAPDGGRGWAPGLGLCRRPAQGSGRAGPGGRNQSGAAHGHQGDKAG